MPAIVSNYDSDAKDDATISSFGGRFTVRSQNTKKKTSRRRNSLAQHQ